jgi:chromosomal replication initiation ATPase DnaA
VKDDLDVVLDICDRFEARMGDPEMSRAIRIVVAHVRASEARFADFLHAHSMEAPPSRPSRLDLRPDFVIDRVCAHYDVVRNDVIGNSLSRNRALDARKMCYFMLRKHTSLSFPEIGRVMGGRDHSTVQYGVRSVQESFSMGERDVVRTVALIENRLFADDAREKADG